ncbi:MobA/MobL family protein [Candidatus Tisiphia endosymbiont of Melanophora roralis]|uniref:MobA/MobL family protein n=1 Tax=Candidatus Tisiphia endosymbiont of Melanophora roralis TaxID=3066261 RepID=UPI00312CB637
MAIYHCNKSEVRRSKGQNAVAASSYISRSKLQFFTTDRKTGEKRTVTYNFSSKKGLVHSVILAPEGSPSWVYDRQELWNRAESSETRKNAETARKLTIALPKELTQQQNTELTEHFASECLVSHGMIADINIHYDNPNNPHVHIQMTTRKLLRLENGEVIFGEKGRDWGRRNFLYYYRENVAYFINQYLEKYGHLAKVSHLSHKARGIDLIPTIHEGTAHYIQDSKLRLINEQILKENAAKIREDIELVFQKLSINKPVFTKEEIAIALADTLAIDLELGQAEKQMGNSANGSIDKQKFQQNLRELSKQLVQKNIQEDIAIDTTIVTEPSSKQDSGVPSTEDTINIATISSVDNSSDNSVTDNNSPVLSDIELLNQEYSTEFMLLYSKLLASDKISLINPSDLKGRTLYALTKRVELEQRFIGIVEELQHSEKHNLSIDDRAIDKISIGKKLIATIRQVGIAVQEIVNNKTGLKIELIDKQCEPLTNEQRKAVREIVNGKDISVLEGYPGTGKTFVMREIVCQYNKAGYRVIGTAPSSTAAQILASSTGIESKNTALLRKEWQEAKGQTFELMLRSDYYKEIEYQHQGRIETSLSLYQNISGELDDKTILIIDEANMVELANMDYLLSTVLKSGSKAIIVGDNNQFAAVGMAGAFKKICTVAKVSTLTEVMRHKHQDDWTMRLQREATKLMGLYKIEKALEIYQGLGVFNIYDNVQVTKEALVTDYINEYLEQAKNLARDDLVSIRSIVIGAYTNVAVNYFNIQVREKLKQAGILKGLSGNFKSGYEMIELLRGEQIVFTSNKAEYKGFNGVLNGEVATVIDFNNPNKFGHGCVQLLVHKADGSKKIVKIDTSDPLYPVQFQYGYAVTGYKLEGETVDYMKIYHEAIMGYEAFNVLMSRFRYEVKLYGARDVLEDIVYRRVEEDAAKGRERFSIESYTYKLSGGKDSKLVREEIPTWYIGLMLGVSRRVDNNLAIDYRKLDNLTPNQQVIKNYLDSRREVFDLRGKMQEWRERQEMPIKLVGLCVLFKQSANVEIQNVREIIIDPYDLMFNREVDEKIDSKDISSKKILWATLSKEKRNQLIWQYLSEYDREELETIYKELQEAKAKLQEHAKIICDNYHGSVSIKDAGGSDVKDQVRMGDRLIQLNLNYQTIQKHAGYSTYKYFLNNINQGATLITNNHWGQMVEICHGLHSTQNDSTDSLNNTNLINIFTTNLANLNEFITETKLLLTERTELLEKTSIEHQEIKKELAEIITYREKLFPEFLSRIYKTPVSKILQKWQDLLVECRYEQLADTISKVKKNPKLLGNFRGIGFGNILGISQRRKDAINNFEVIAKRFRNYEQGVIKAQELQNKLTTGNYLKLLESLSAEITSLTASLPNKYEQSFLDQLYLLQKEGKLTIENLAALAKEDDLQGLIYEYYNYINDAELAKLAISISADIQGEDQKEITSNKIEEVRDGKVRLETNKYDSINAARNERLDFNEVIQSLSEYNYRNIFESYARRINSDGKNFKRSGAEISLGSLSMNLRKGLWIRHSTGEGGNIFSFVQKALNCSKLEALEQVASISGIRARANNYHNDNYSSNKQLQESDGYEKIVTQPINEWYAQPYVPESAPKFDPNIHLAGILKSNTIAGIYYYRNDKSQLIGLTVRLISNQDGTKQVLPVSYCQNESLNKEAWRLKGFSDNGYKPIYHIEKITDEQKSKLNTTILIVEGERTCDKAQELLPEYIVLSWLGGSNSADKANWQQLRGRRVVIWPDHDQAGIKAARTICHMINEANGHIGNVTIIDPSQLEFNGTIHTDILLEKWDLADQLPVGCNIDNIREAIINCQQQNSSLSYSQSMAARLQQLLPQKERAIGERILWQARSSGTIFATEHIRQEAAKEVSWQEKLTSSEANYYVKYAETTKKDGSKHEFLGLQDSLYRDTLVAIAVNSEIKDKECLELPKLIAELQHEYEQKQRTLSYDSSGRSFGYDDHYQSHIASLESYGADRVELYHIMVRDVSLLHQEQLSGIKGKIIKAYQRAIEQTVYQQIKTYQIRQARNQTSNKLDYDDKVKISSKIYDNLCSSKWWQSLVEKDLTYIQKLQQKVQIKLAKNNSYERRIEEIIEKYKGQNPRLINNELINKWTSELEELKTYSADSLSDIIKIGEEKGLGQAFKEIVSINDNKNRELKIVLEVYKDRIDEIQKFNDKFNVEDLKHQIKPLKYNDMVKAVDKIRVDSFRDWIIPQFNKIEKERQELQQVNGLLNSLEQERDLSLKMGKDYQSLTYRISEEMEEESINDKRRVYDCQPDLLENIKRDSLYIAKHNIWEEELLIRELKRNTSELKDRVAPLMFKFSQQHCKKQIEQDIKIIKEQGILIKENKQQFKTVQSYLNDLMNNQEIKPYIRGADFEIMLVEGIKDTKQVAVLTRQLYKERQAHVLKELSPEIQELKEHGMIKINNNTYDAKSYLEYRMNDKLIAPYLKNTEIEKRLTEIYRQKQQLDQQKQSELTREKII